MDTDRLIEAYPQLFHMTEARTWRTVERLGLRSVTSLLDLFDVRGRRRERLESERRPDPEPLRHPVYGEVVIRDQKPLDVGKLAACLTDMTVAEWLRLLRCRPTSRGKLRA